MKKLFFIFLTFYLNGFESYTLRNLAKNCASEKQKINFGFKKLTPKIYTVDIKATPELLKFYKEMVATFGICELYQNKDLLKNLLHKTKEQNCPYFINYLAQEFAGNISRNIFLPVLIKTELESIYKTIELDQTKSDLQDMHAKLLQDSSARAAVLENLERISSRLKSPENQAKALWLKTKYLS